MSMWIDVDKVSGVLLSDGWHVVVDDSFDIDSYEMHHKERAVLKGGKISGVPSTGAMWTEMDVAEGEKVMVYCPLTSIIAVRCRVDAG